MSKTGEAIAAIGLSVAAATGLGIVVENHTNNIAEGKIITADTCVDAYRGTPGIITGKMVECMENDWVPGAEPIGVDTFEEGQPVELVDGYVKVQKDEADSFDWQRVAIWSSLGLIGGIFLFGETDEEKPEEAAEDPVE